MSEKSTFEEWQTGVLMTLGSAIVGALFAMILGSATGTMGAYLGFVGGLTLTFLLLSYLLYGQ